MAAWNPTTGASLGGDDLAALLAAAQPVGDKPTEDMDDAAQLEGVPLVHSEPVVPSVVCTVVVVYQHWDGQSDQFVSQDKHATASRICSYLQGIVHGDTSSMVKIDCGTMGAMACKDALGRYLTSWMDKAVAAEYKHNPTFVVTPAEHVSHWALAMVTMFEGAVARKHQLEQMMTAAAERRRAREVEKQAEDRRSQCAGAAVARAGPEACPAGVW